jgi:hypothetical protein
LCELKQQSIKSDRNPFLIRNIPFFHHSIIPWVMRRQLLLTGIKLKLRHRGAFSGFAEKDNQEDFP